MFISSMMSAARSFKIVTYSEAVRESDGSFLASFKQHYPSGDITILDYDKEHDKKLMSEADIVLAGVRRLPEYIQDLKNAKWLQLSSAGFDIYTNYVKQTGKVPAFKVTRLGGTFGTAMAEYVVTHIVSHERRFNALKEGQTTKKWRSEEFREYRVLSELTIGIVGAGDIGCEIAKHCKSFGMRTIGLVSREKSSADRSEFIDEYRLTADLDYVLSESDVICSILPSRPDTIELYKEDTFQACTKKPLFINVGRGDVVKDTTIVKAIRNGWLSGAVLDVFKPEPLPPESLLWDVPEVTITPHVSCILPGKFVCQLFLRNYAKFMRGEKLDYEIDVTTVLAQSG